MNCTCSCLSPFRWASFPRDSIFLTAPKQFTVGASQGKSASQIASETVKKITEKNGRSPGTLMGISPAADRQAEQRIYNLSKKLKESA
jgi:hypothetical protein